MRTRLFRYLSSVILVLSLSLPFAAGQSDTSIERGVKLEAPDQNEQDSSSPSALPYFVMAIYTLLVLTIVCMPSRKA